MRHPCAKRPAKTHIVPQQIEEVSALTGPSRLSRSTNTTASQANRQVLVTAMRLREKRGGSASARGRLLSSKLLTVEECQPVSDRRIHSALLIIPGRRGRGCRCGGGRVGGGELVAGGGGRSGQGGRSPNEPAPQSQPAAALLQRQRQWRRRRLRLRQRLRLLEAQFRNADHLRSSISSSNIWSQSAGGGA